MEIAPKATRKCIEEQNYAEALIMSLKLNEVNLIQEIIEKIPAKESKQIFKYYWFNVDVLRMNNCNWRIIVYDFEF